MGQSNRTKSMLSVPTEEATNSGKTPVSEVKAGAFAIVKYNDNSYSVSIDGNVCANSKGAMRQLADALNFAYKSSWTTQQFGAKLSKYIKTNVLSISQDAQHKSNISAIKEVFEILAREQGVSGNSGFSADKEAIMKIFTLTSDYSKQDILVRLTLIDSMYSTQMSRRYYALGELAEALAKIADGKQGQLKRMFLDFAANPSKEVDRFNYDTTNLFSECYGIGKDGEDKGVAISLISKYAYFETGFRFPIYDSIACEMYPIVWESCEFGKGRPKLAVSEGGKKQGAATMVKYVDAINILTEKFGIADSDYKYDHLDRFLWFVGKIRRGNLSLVITRDEYEDTIRKTQSIITTKNKDGKETTTTEYFNIEKVDLDKLDFLKTNILLRKFFELAKFYGHKR